MELGIFERQLRLMVLLTQNREYTLDELCGKLNMSRRTLYRYLELFKDMGFEVMKQGNVYRLDKSSPFFKEITQLIHFTEDEAITLRYVLDTLQESNLQARQLRRKLERLYDFGVLSAPQSDRRQADSLQVLYEAVKQHRQVVLKNYSSVNSNSEDDRVVEPYMFLNNNSEIRCFEIKTGQNKTFKISRIGQVVLLDLLWSHEQKHTVIYTDLFHFTGEERFPVILRLGRLASSLLKEEYPYSASLLQPDGPNHWILRLQVCSYLGVGRFVLGLFEDIEIIDSPHFSLFLREKLYNLTKKTD